MNHLGYLMWEIGMPHGERPYLSKNLYDFTVSLQLIGEMGVGRNTPSYGYEAIVALSDLGWIT